MDPVTATALALEATAPDAPGVLVMVSCDLSGLSDALRAAVRDRLRQRLPELDPAMVVFNATHTHTGPMANSHDRYTPTLQSHTGAEYGVDFGGMDTADYIAFAADRIAGAIIHAWENRAPGGIAYGLGFAVVGRNRLTAYRDGTSKMCGPVNHPEFSHMEGGADPSLHVLATYDTDRRLTGLVLNLACPSQISEQAMRVSADYWHEVREELHRRHGATLHILAQCAPAGDQSPHLHGSECRRPRQTAGRENPEVRMWRLAGRSQREEIGTRIADAVATVLPLIEKEMDWTPRFAHRVETVELPRRLIPETDVEQSREEAAAMRVQYETLMLELESDPRRRDDPEWKRATSRAFQLMRRSEKVVERFERQKIHPKLSLEIHVARLGDVAFATNPFEFYLDYGLQIQARTRCVQAFLVQLAGPGSYVPTERSIRGGAFGTVPASTEIGPAGAHELVEWTIAAANAFWDEAKPAEGNGP